MDKTESGILARMKADIPSRYSTQVGGYIHDVLAPVAIELEKAYGIIDNILKDILIESAEGEALDTALEQLGFGRKRATYARGIVTITGAKNAVIHAGDLVANGKNVYVVQTTKALENGSVDVEVVASESGSAGNAEPGAINYFPIVLPGIVSVSNAAAIVGGTDAETDKAYKERYYYFREYPVTSGNKYEYEQLAREVEGVGVAKCYPLWNGNGTVKIVITAADMSPASDELVETVAAYIAEQRPIGADVTVESAKTISVFVTAKVECLYGYNVSDIGLRLEAVLSQYFKDVGFAGGVIPYTKLGALLQEIDGVVYYTDLTVNGAEENITVEDGYLAVLGGVSLV